MPAYNAGGTIAAAIMSIKDQTYENWELIIVDDGSVDIEQTETILDRIKDPRIKLIKQKHGDVVKARMTGYKAAKGAILIQQDADDLSMPDRLERVVNWFEKHPKDDVYCSSLYVSIWQSEFSAIRRQYRQAKKVKKESLLKAQTIPGVVAFRKYVVEKRPLREETRYVYDWSMHLDWMYSGFKYGFDPVATYEYVRRRDSLSERNEKAGARHQSLLQLATIMKNEYSTTFTPDDWNL